jgi:hypothetical protein
LIFALVPDKSAATRRSLSALFIGFDGPPAIGNTYSPLIVSNLPFAGFIAFFAFAEVSLRWHFDCRAWSDKRQGNGNRRRNSRVIEFKKK